MVNECMFAPDSKEMRMLRKLMETSFFLTDLNLYLDTHPEDERALCLYRKTAEQYNCQHQYFCENVFPLTANTAGMNEVWNWFDGTWPPAKI